jgi:hypothetical protein
MNNKPGDKQQEVFPALTMRFSTLKSLAAIVRSFYDCLAATDISQFETIFSKVPSRKKFKFVSAMEPSIAEIKDSLSVVSYIGSYVRLQKVGSRWRGLCPFHQEKTPSFYVSDEYKRFHCFGCQSKGDLIDFVQKVDGLTTNEAIQLLRRA